MGATTTTKLGPKQKRCCDCKKVKHKFKDFRSRWNRCQKHKEQGLAKDDKKVLACSACEEARNATIRQPRCVECDAKRGSKKDKGKKVTKVTAGKKKAKPSKASPTVTAPAEPVATTATTAPSPTPPPAPSPAPAPAPAPVAAVHHTAPPASPPAPSGVVSSLAAVDSLLGDEKESRRTPPDQ